MELIRLGRAWANHGGRFLNMSKSMSKGQSGWRNIGWEMGGKAGKTLETRGGLERGGLQGTGWSAVCRACHGYAVLVRGILIVM